MLKGTKRARRKAADSRGKRSIKLLLDHLLFQYAVTILAVKEAHHPEDERSLRADVYVCWAG